MCSPVSPHFQEKKQLQSVKLSSSTEWRSEMMKTNEGTWDNSIGKHQHPRQSQSLPWVKAKILVLSWWLTGRYFQLLIIPVTYKEKSVFWKLQLVFGSAVWNGDMSFTVTQNKTLWGGEGPVLTLNSAVTFSSVLTNVGTAVMKINFFKKLYIQFAVDIPYVLLFVFIYDYQFNINIVSKKNSLWKWVWMYTVCLIFIHKEWIWFRMLFSWHTEH